MIKESANKKAEISDIDDKTSMFKMMRNKQENKS